MVKYQDYTILCEAELDYLRETVKSVPAGDVVVCGTLRGGDVMAMMDVSPDRNYVVVDSFKGLSEPHKVKDNGTPHKASEFSIEGGRPAFEKNFKRAKAPLPQEIHQMYITEESIKVVKDRPVSLVWADLDFWEPTLSVFNHFAPMLVKDGKILTHDLDFSHTPGIRTAVHDSKLPFVRVEPFNIGLYVKRS